MEVIFLEKVGSGKVAVMECVFNPQDNHCKYKTSPYFVDMAMNLDALDAKELAHIILHVTCPALSTCQGHSV